MSENLELKAYKQLAEIRGRLLEAIIFKCKNISSEYFDDKPERHTELIKFISDSSKWEYCGLLKDKDKSVLETLEYLLNDNMNDIIKK